MKRTKHSLSNYKLLTCDMGLAVPCGLTEVLPGDSFQHSAQALVRVTPLTAPVMHPVVARIHHFFVPHRLVWSGFEDFITGGADGNDTSTIPQFTGVTVTEGSIPDYLGVPPGSGRDYSRLPINGHRLIYNEWMRDQDLVTAKTESAYGSTSPWNIAWEKDYFTEARPWTQKGDAVTVPLGDIESDGSAIILEDSTGATQGQVETNAGNLERAGTSSIAQHYVSGLQMANTDVIALREAFSLQRYKEARARYGSRYTEYLRYCGVNPADSRLQRPEYLGGGSPMLQFSEVVQTAPETDQTSPTEYGTGDLYGHGIAAIGGRPYRRYFDEHGYVHSILSIRPKSMYAEGLDRHWSKLDKEDFFQKELQDIGQQEVYNREVYADHTTPAGVFGYGDRYREYGGVPSSVAGDFRSTLNYWHLAREFASDPALNSTFINCSPSKRIFNEQTAHSMWVMVKHNIKSRRMVRRSHIGKIR